MSTQVQSFRLMLHFNYSALQCKPEELSANMSVCVDANITGTFRKFFLKFIINYFNVYYKISTPVVFCPGGLLSGVGIFSGLLSGGLLSVLSTPNFSSQMIRSPICDNTDNICYDLLKFNVK